MALNALVHLAKGGLDKDGHMLVLARAVSIISITTPYQADDFADHHFVILSLNKTWA